MIIPKSNGAGGCSSLAIQVLIDERSRELGLSRSELVQRCGYKNISKGIRRLDELYAGDLQRTAHLLAGLAMRSSCRLRLSSEPFTRPFSGLRSALCAWLWRLRQLGARRSSRTAFC
jgi:hypothetical protein